MQSNLAEAAEIAEYDMVNFRSWQRSQIKRQLVYALKVACEHDEAKLEEVAKFKMQWKIRAAGRFLFRNAICDMAKSVTPVLPVLSAKSFDINLESQAPGAGSSDCPSTSRQISEESLISCKCACDIATESLILTHFYNFVGEGSTLYGFSVPLGSKTSLI